MRCDDDGQKNQHQYDDTSHGKRILAQASHTILEECGRLTHDILLLLFLICRLLEICLIEFAQIYLCRQNLSMFQLNVTKLAPSEKVKIGTRTAHSATEQRLCAVFLKKGMTRKRIEKSAKKSYSKRINYATL